MPTVTVEISPDFGIRNHLVQISTLFRGQCLAKCKHIHQEAFTCGENMKGVRICCCCCEINYCCSRLGKGKSWFSWNILIFWQYNIKKFNILEMFYFANFLLCKSPRYLGQSKKISPKQSEGTKGLTLSSTYFCPHSLSSSFTNTWRYIQPWGFWSTSMMYGIAMCISGSWSTVLSSREIIAGHLWFSGLSCIILSILSVCHSTYYGCEVVSDTKKDSFL